LSVGRFIEKKGLEYGIRAVSNVLKKYPNIKYNIAGDGPLKSQFEELINERRVSKNIKLLGWKTQSEIRKLMKKSDIMIAPSVTSSRGDQEGIPVTLIEALATGLPVITTGHSGIPELVQDGKSGLIVPERDVNYLTDRICYLIEHPEIWSVLALAGRKYIEAHYDIDKLNDRLVKRYKRLITK
jgi:colanic acid/amylovoran biosynthesis glycosyltransferase